jgi:hypothetical protein
MSNNYICTKTLYDWASNADLDFTDPDAAADAITVWHNAWVQSPEHLVEVYHDFVSDKYAKMICEGIAKASRDGQWIEEEAKNHPYMIAAYSASLNLHLGTAGGYLQKALSEMILDHVKKTYDDCWVDVCGYHLDMEEGRHEDYEIKRYAEAQGND